MKRLFTYGCSFTNYIWPMWPLFLTKNFDLVYNRGKPGAGNEYIFHALLQDLQQFKIDSNDTIYLMWSGYSRFDICVNHRYWQTDGFIYADKTINEIEEIDKYWKIEGSIVKTFIYINSTIKLLESLGIRFKFLDAFGLFQTNNELTSNVLNHWNEILPKYLTEFDREKYFPTNTLQSYLNKQEIPYQKIWEGNLKFDGHPTVEITLDYVLNELQSIVDYDIDSQAIQLGKEIHQAILDVQPYDHSWIKDIDKIFNITTFGKFDNQSLEKFLSFYESRKIYKYIS